MFPPIWNVPMLEVISFLYMSPPELPEYPLSEASITPAFMVIGDDPVKSIEAVDGTKTICPDVAEFKAERNCDAVVTVYAILGSVEVMMRA